MEDAVLDLREQLDSVGFSKEMLQKTAADWDVEVPVLMRAFRAKTGSTPMEYVPIVKVDVEDALLESAKKLAFEWLDEEFVGTGSRIAGKVFERNGNKMIAVAWTGCKVFYIDPRTKKRPECFLQS